MKKVVYLALGIVIGLVGSAAGFSMDESDCKNPTAAIFASDLADHVNATNKRLIACVNFLMEQEVDNHNAQQDLFRDLAAQIGQMEARISQLEAR